MRGHACQAQPPGYSFAEFCMAHSGVLHLNDPPSSRVLWHVKVALTLSIFARRSCSGAFMGRSASPERTTLLAPAADRSAPNF
jgi:hypothetical protein